jgi:hypothetical protein
VNQVIFFVIVRLEKISPGYPYPLRQFVAEDRVFAYESEIINTKSFAERDHRAYKRQNLYETHFGNPELGGGITPFF